MRWLFCFIEWNLIYAGIFVFTDKKYVHFEVTKNYECFYSVSLHKCFLGFLCQLKLALSFFLAN